MQPVMRTTLTLDDDVLAVTRNIAEREQKSLGAVVSMLVRQALSHELPMTTPTVRNGVPLLPVQPGAAPVTLEIVNRLRDELP